MQISKAVKVLSPFVLLVTLLLPPFASAMTSDSKVSSSSNNFDDLKQETIFYTFLNGSSLISSEVQNIQIQESSEISDKLIFKKAQLRKLKADLTKLYLRYQNKDVNKEPLKSKFDKEINKIFQKNLKVKNVTTENFGIFLYPEIGMIMRDIKNKYPKKSVATNNVNTSENGIKLSKLKPESVSISKLDKLSTTPLTFVISKDSDVKSVCNKVFNLNAKGVDVFEPRELCSAYYGKKGVFSDLSFFANKKSSISGSYETRGGKTYFENEGIDHQIVMFYVVDSAGKKSNSLKFTFTR